jgi:lipopolysaccharide transport system permease protein
MSAATHRAPTRSKAPIRRSTAIVINPPGRFQLPSLSQLWEAREVFTRFGIRDITLRYRQTALGVIWVVLQPLLSAGVFTLVFGKVAKLSSGGVPYFVFSFTGMLAWNVFNGVVSRASGALVSNAALVSKVFFPRILVPLSTAYSVMVDFAVSFVLMIILLISFRINPGWAVVLTPVWLLGVLLISSGLGVITSALTVKFRDVQYVVPFLLQVFLYASPIAYALSSVPQRYRIYYNLNPLTWLLQDFRWSLLHQVRPPTWHIAGSIAVPFAVFIVCALVFEQMERGFADII